MENDYMEILDLLKFRYVGEKDLVYWVECNRDDVTGIFIYVVRSGYYLASYMCNDTAIHIVSLGNVIDCEVRHLSNNQLFITEEIAQKKANELNEIKTVSISTREQR